MKYVAAVLLLALAKKEISIINYLTIKTMLTSTPPYLLSELSPTRPQ